MLKDQVPSLAIKYLNLTTDRKLDAFLNHQFSVNYDHRSNFKKPLESQNNLRSTIGFNQNKLMVS